MAMLLRLYGTGRRILLNPAIYLSVRLGACAPRRLLRHNLFDADPRDERAGAGGVRRTGESAADIGRDSAAGRHARHQKYSREHAALFLQAYGQPWRR